MCNPLYDKQVLFWFGFRIGNLSDINGIIRMSKNKFNLRVRKVPYRVILML